MAQIQSPETYVDGQQVTATRLNNQTNGATLLPGAITDQTNITANTVASGDSLLLYDLSATALREANVSDVLGSNLPVTTSAVTAGANSDIVVTPNDGTIVTGQAYTSADGLTVTVTSTAHTLTVGQVILVTAAATGYNGTFRVATVATNSFTYVMTTAATAGSGTLSYTKKGLVKNPANESVAGNLYVDGSTAVAGAMAVAGATTLAGTNTISGATTVTGLVNITGDFQVNGSVGYVLTEITEETVTPFSCVGASAGYNAWVLGWTSATHTKPVGEIWKFELALSVKPNSVAATQYADHFIWTSNNAVTVTYDYRQGKNIGFVAQTNSAFHKTNLDWVVNAGTALTADNVGLRVFIKESGTAGQYDFGTTATDAITGVAPPASKLRIYKYRTA